MATRKRTTSGKTPTAPRKRVTRKKPAADAQVTENVAPVAPPGPVSMSEVRNVEIDGQTVDLASQRLAEEMQDLGVDVVPSGEIHVGADAGAPLSLLSDWDFHLFNEGSHHRLWEKLGAHVVERAGVAGTIFAVWAPNAAAVSVIGDWNGWNRDANHLAA